MRKTKPTEKNSHRQVCICSLVATSGSLVQRPALRRGSKIPMVSSRRNSLLFTYFIGVVRHPVQECTTLLTSLSGNGPCGHTRSSNQAHGDTRLLLVGNKK
jgi:hypothetical protein